MEDFETHRRLLFSIAYRMLGSAAEAEDIVQEAYLRYSGAPPGEIRSLKSYLAAIVTNLCLDHLKSARVRREQYVGPWLPEPLLTGDGELLALETLEQRESISLAFMVLLEALTPQERAVFLLREVFEYGYDEIAAILDKPAATCRQIFHRASERLAGRRRRFVPSREEQSRLTERFLLACQAGDVGALAEMLAQDVVSWSDGGGQVAAARHPVRGRDAVIRFLLGLVRRAPPDLRITFAEVNGEHGVLLWNGDTLFDVLVLESDGRSITGLRWVLNPDKLAYIAAQLST